MLVIGNPEGFIDALAQALVKPMLSAEIYKAKLEQLQAKNKKHQTALLNIAEETITANSAESMKTTAREALKSVSKMPKETK